jgi:hypothetical protein
MQTPFIYGRKRDRGKGFPGREMQTCTPDMCKHNLTQQQRQSAPQRQLRTEDALLMQLLPALSFPAVPEA